MNKNNMLINLGLVFSLLFCMAFACNEGDEKNDAPPPKSRTQTTRQDDTADDDTADDDTASPMETQTGVGKPYGARDPRDCPDAKQPTRGAMSAAQATQYVICGLEHVYGENLYLAENVKVTVGGGIPYNPNNFPYATDIDPEATVYPIRAGFEKYQCGRLSTVSDDKGKNCTVYRSQKATGVCVKTTFGDWRCSITSSDQADTKYNMPPPQE